MSGRYVLCVLSVSVGQAATKEEGQSRAEQSRVHAKKGSDVCNVRLTGQVEDERVSSSQTAACLVPNFIN